MNDEQLKLIEENIAEVISGNILLSSDGPRIAAMVMERLEVKDLLGGTQRIYPAGFTNNGTSWSMEDLDACLIRHDASMLEHVFIHPKGKEIRLGDAWIESHLAEGAVYMIDLIHKKSGEIT